MLFSEYKAGEWIDCEFIDDETGEVFFVEEKRKRARAQRTSSQDVKKSRKTISIALNFSVWLIPKKPKSSAMIPIKRAQATQRRRASNRPLFRRAVDLRPGAFCAYCTTFATFSRKTLCILTIDKSPKLWYNIGTEKERQGTYYD